MARYARIATVTQGGGRGATVPERVENALSQAIGHIDRIAPDRPDLILLPETFTGLGCGQEEWIQTAQPVPGPTTDRLAEKAHELNCYIVCPIVRREGERLFNSAVLLDRQGEVTGIYNKVHPTIGEIEAGITPGTETPVFSTDFGRVGFAICYDLNFRDVVEGLAANNAELICFPSMYRGGLQTRIWAFDFGVYFASATPSEGSVIVNPAGRILERSSHYEPVISHRINLDFAQLHIDYNAAQWPKMKAKYGTQVEIEVVAEEGRFVLYSHHPEITVPDLIAEFGLETCADYFARANRIRAEALERIANR